MLSTGCVAPAAGSGVPTNPFACADLHLPYYGRGNDGWHVSLGWFVDHPIVTSLVFMIVLTIMKSLTQRKLERS